MAHALLLALVLGFPAQVDLDDEHEEDGDPLASECASLPRPALPRTESATGQAVQTLAVWPASMAITGVPALVVAAIPLVVLVPAMCVGATASCYTPWCIPVGLGSVLSATGLAHVATGLAMVAQAGITSAVVGFPGPGRSGWMPRLLAAHAVPLVLAWLLAGGVWGLGSAASVGAMITGFVYAWFVSSSYGGSVLEASFVGLGAAGLMASAVAAAVVMFTGQGVAAAVTSLLAKQLHDQEALVPAPEPAR